MSTSARGAHYTQFMVYDFDGDGRSETMLKTAPGTKSIRYNTDGSVASSAGITMLPEDVAAGYAATDDYRMTAAEYRLHLIELFQGWSEHPEVVAGHWPATLEEAWGIPVTHEYPLTEAAATELTDYFISTYAPSRSARNDLTTFDGFIVDGPEYLTVFDSATGEELETVRYKPGRDDDGLLWGDYAMARIEPGNRVDRFLAGVAYLDGRHPSAVFARGYYTRTTLVAYDWDGEHLAERWYVDSGHVPMTNPFNDSPHGRDGTDPVYGTLYHAGLPLAERRRRGRRRQARDRLRRRHHRRRRRTSLQLVRRPPRGKRRARRDRAPRPRRCDTRHRHRSRTPGTRDLDRARGRDIRSVWIRDAGCRDR